MLTDYLLSMRVPNQYIKIKRVNKIGTGKVGYDILQVINVVKLTLW